jgi:hypothetical protein
MNKEKIKLIYKTKKSFIRNDWLTFCFMASYYCTCYIRKYLSLNHHQIVVSFLLEVLGLCLFENFFLINQAS